GEVTGVGVGGSGVGNVWEMSGGVEPSQSWGGSRRDSADTTTSSVTSASTTTTTTYAAVHWDTSLQAHTVVPPPPQVAAAPAAAPETASPWGLDTELLQAGGVGLSPQVSMSPPTSSTPSPSTPADTEAFARPVLGRMSSLMWLTEPTPSRRPTIHESTEVDRLLAKNANFAAWT
ncbi:unnamed protein product, partial [Laminaria digitata]